MQEQSQKISLARQKSTENHKKKKDRQVRYEVKKRLIEHADVNKENMEIIETDRNILKVRKTKVIVEKSGKKRTQTVMKMLVDVTTKTPNKRKSNTPINAGPSKVTPEALRIRSKKLVDTAKSLSSTKEEEAIVTAKFLDSQTKDEQFN